MLDTVDIEGLKGVGKVELKFDPNHRVRVLFGVNGVGKTKTLEAIYLGALLTNTAFVTSEMHAALRSQTWCPASKVSIDGNLCVQFSPSDSGLNPLREAIAGSASPHDRPVLLIGAGGRSSVEAAPARAEVLGTFTKRRSAYYDYLLRDLRDNTLRSSGMTSDVRAWFVQRAQSVNPYQVEKDNLQNEIDAVLQLLNELDSRVAADKLQIDAAQRVFLHVDGRSLELAELSSGFASVLKLFQAIISAYSNFTNSKDLRNLPGIVLIDEIESHLHVSWQTSIVQKLRSLFPNTLFVIATHSPLVLTQLEQGEAYVIERDQDGVVRSREIDSPNMKAFADVLEETFGVDLNALKRDALAQEDQTEAKQALLDLIKRRREQRAQEGGE